MDPTTARLLGAVRDPLAPADAVTRAWTELFDQDAVLATSAGFDLLAGEPRTKPSRRLLVDPGDTARRRWELRVAAAAALLAAPDARAVFAELHDELAHDPELAADVLARATPSTALTAGQRAAVDALRPHPQR